MLTLLDLTLFFRNLGQFIFDTQIHNGAKLDTIFELLLAIIYVALPWGTIINYVNEENFYLNKNPYN